MAIQQNLVLEQGTDFQAVIKLYADNTTVLNLNGYTATSQMRRSYDSVTATATLAVAIPIPGNGELYLTLAAASSTSIRYGRYLYDVVLTQTSTGTLSRAVEGIITVTPRVTR
jgi:hypothetical protein